MRSNAVKSVEETIDVGTVVQVALSDVGTTQVDPGNLTLVVVEIRKDIARYRLACLKGPKQNGTFGFNLQICLLSPQCDSVY